MYYLQNKLDLVQNMKNNWLAVNGSNTTRFVHIIMVTSTLKLHININYIDKFNNLIAHLIKIHNNLLIS